MNKDNNFSTEDSNKFRHRAQSPLPNRDNDSDYTPPRIQHRRNAIDEEVSNNSNTSHTQRVLNSRLSEKNTGLKK